MQISFGSLVHITFLMWAFSTENVAHHWISPFVCVFLNMVLASKCKMSFIIFIKKHSRLDTICSSSTNWLSHWCCISSYLSPSLHVDDYQLPRRQGDFSKDGLHRISKKYHAMPLLRKYLRRIIFIFSFKTCFICAPICVQGQSKISVITF